MRFSCCLLLAGVLLSGCESASTETPDLKGLYRHVATSEVRNPVIVIHGILGSRLMRPTDGKVVWGAFTNEALSPETPEGARALALPFDRTGHAARDWDVGAEPVVATGPVDRIAVDVLFFSVNVNVYAGILRTLGVGGYRDPVVTDYGGPDYGEHFTCYSFFYDWRQDCIANARALGRFMAEKRGEIRRTLPGYIARLRERGDAAGAREADALEEMLGREIRFDVVAHSMGGLLARWYLRYGDQDLPPDDREPELDWRGSADIDRLLLVGTPSAGSLFALQRLTEGFQPAFITPYYDPAVIGTMPSLYQLLPRTRHGAVQDAAGETVDFMDPEVWIRNRWGPLRPESREVLGWLLPDETPEARLARAGDMVRNGLRQARRFHAALDRVPDRPCPSRISLFAADTAQTPRRVRLKPRDDGTLVPDFAEAEMTFGDGTVPRYSALADERETGEYAPFLRSPVPWHSAVFIPDDHVGLTSNPVFANNVLHVLLETPPGRVDGAR